MIQARTIELLCVMRPGVTAQGLEELLGQYEVYNALGFEERLGLLVDAEWTHHQGNKLRRYIQNARFAVPSATVEGIEYHEDRKLDKAETLRLSTATYIKTDII